MIIICREVDKNTGKIAVYPLDAEVTDRVLFVLGLRAKLNPELTYYATTRRIMKGSRTLSRGL